MKIDVEVGVSLLVLVVGRVDVSEIYEINKIFNSVFVEVGVELGKIYEE